MGTQKKSRENQRETQKKSRRNTVGIKGKYKQNTEEIRGKNRENTEEVQFKESIGEIHATYIWHIRDVKGKYKGSRVDI